MVLHGLTVRLEKFPTKLYGPMELSSKPMLAATDE